MFIKVKVFPSSSRDEIIIKKENFFEIKTKKPAKNGQANEAVYQILSNHFRVSLKNIRLIKGKNQRNKIFEIKEK